MISNEEQEILRAIGLTRVCRKCKEIKIISEYRKESSSAYAFRTECIQCENERSRVYYRDHKDEAREYNQHHRKANSYRYWSYKTRTSHTSAGYTVLITLEETIKLAQESTHCKICRDLLNWNLGEKKQGPLSNSPTLDRINQEMVLTTDSVQVICSRCNLTKSNRTMNEFIEYCRLVAKRFSTEGEYNESLR